jgi:hypothetical protein
MVIYHLDQREVACTGSMELIIQDSRWYPVWYQKDYWQDDNVFFMILSKEHKILKNVPGTVDSGDGIPVGTGVLRAS